MLKNDILKIVDFYKNLLLDSGYKSKQNGKELEHVLYMIEKIETLELDKAFRWLGFIQGILYCKGIFTIEELKKHSSKHNFISAKF